YSQEEFVFMRPGNSRHGGKCRAAPLRQIER
ncbi:MAG: hypothetical protein ACI8W7_002002, partial [Gammaproteobacteria bacterium]